MSTSLTLTPRKPTSDFNQDVNGDGIPDGAQISMAREIMDDAGSKTLITAKWNKGTSRPPAGVMGDTPPANTPGSTAMFDAPPPGPAPAPKSPTAAEIFKERTDRNGDRMGMGRSNITERPVLLDDKITALNSKAGNMSNSVADRQSAIRELDQLLGIQDRTANRDLARHQSDNQRDAAIATNQGKQTIEEIRKEGKVESAGIATKGKMSIEELRAELKKAELEQRGTISENTLASKEKMNREKIDAYSSQREAVTNAKDKASKLKAVDAMLDTKIGAKTLIPGSGKTLRQYIIENYDLETGKLRTGVTPDEMFEKNIPFVNQELIKISGRPFIGSSSTQDEVTSKNNESAITWAKANPNDPRSAAILKKLGVK